MNAGIVLYSSEALKVEAILMGELGEAIVERYTMDNVIVLERCRRYYNLWSIHKATSDTIQIYNNNK